MPPDPSVGEVEINAQYWVFVEPKNLIAPNAADVILPLSGTAALVEKTVVVNQSIVRINNAATTPELVPKKIAYLSFHVLRDPYRAFPFEKPDQGRTETRKARAPSRQSAGPCRPRISRPHQTHGSERRDDARQG
jgi:hypothetical protein